jgi:transposase
MEPSVMEITTIGLDIAKNFFQVHAVDAAGAVVVRKMLRRAQVLSFFSELAPCLVGMEACGSSHYWGREIGKIGHTVRLMPANYVKPYVKRGKTDANDAEAICEAVTRPTMRFVAVKSPEQQAILSLHRARELLVKQRTQLVNMMRGLLGEFGITIPVGLQGALRMARDLIATKTLDVPKEAMDGVELLSRQVIDLHLKILEMERGIRRWHRGSEASQRLATIPGVGPIGATALVASITDPHQFRSGRELAAWIGLTPRQNSSGGKERLGRISKMGDRYLRKLLFLGATAILKYSKLRKENVVPRALDLLARKPARVAAIALANRTARVVWAMLARGESYRSNHVPALAA